MEFGDRHVSQEAEAALAADAALARQFTDLLQQARQAEGELRRAQADGAPIAELRRLGKALDAALTEVMRAAYAAERVEIGARGYDDRIYRRKAKAKPAVKAWTAEAEALLTLREAHRLGGIVRLPPAPAA
ncbi:MAG TPA: hypothetical protein VGI31_03095 [Streptosporangiaceae bacterium]|jgi:hypothetical protein